VREFIADLFVTLDGFALGESVGPFFGYAGPELESWVLDQLDRPQVMVMGRITYEALSKLSQTSTDPISERMNNLRKVVVSNTLHEPLAWSNTRLVKGDVADAIRALKQQAGDPLRCIGSITLVKTMMPLRLVDRLRLMVFPLVLGRAGREPIFAGYGESRLELIDTKVIDSRLVLLEYRPAGS
jgi:dihydrofolate reductase